MLKVCRAAMRRSVDRDAPEEGFTLHLFKNAVTITKDTVLGDFTESTFDGYSAQALSWNPAADDGATALATADEVTFTTGAGFTGTELIYGYYTTDSVGNYGFGETIPGGPVTLSVIGQEHKVYPQFRLKNFGE